MRESHGWCRLPMLDEDVAPRAQTRCQPVEIPAEDRSNRTEPVRRRLPSAHPAFLDVRQGGARTQGVGGFDRLQRRDDRRPSLRQPAGPVHRRSVR